MQHHNLASPEDFVPPHDQFDPGYDCTAGNDPSPWFGAWRKATERARARTAELRVDVAYGSASNERLDVYQPAYRLGRRSFAMFVHGGEWRREMRALSGFAAKAVHHQGAVFIAVGVTPLPEADLAAQVEQVCRAWSHVVQHAPRFGIDPSRGHLLGHCSGAHLAAMAAFQVPDTRPLSAVLLSGIYDLEPLRRSARNQYLGLDARSAARLSPIHHVPAGAPDLVVAWGEREAEEFRHQSREFARVCKARGARVVQGELPGCGHLDTSFELVNQHSTVYATLRER